MRDAERELSKLAQLADALIAEPEPVEILRRRARRRRAGRAAAGAGAVAVMVGAVAGVLGLTGGSEPDRPGRVDLAAPTVLLGNIDASVLSTVYDEDGARTRLPADLVDTIAAVPGVEAATGAVQRFAPVYADGVNPMYAGMGDGPPRTAVAISVHQPDEVEIVSGAYPDEAGELLVNADLLERAGLSVDQEVDVSLVPGAAERWRVSGVFALPGGDVPRSPVIAIPTTAMTDRGDQQDVFDRIDIVLSDGTDAEATKAAIQQLLPQDTTVYSATELGTAEQVRAELEIQHAYWALLGTDPQERFDSREPDGTTIEQMTAAFEQYKEMADQAELRVQRVQFLTPDRATLVYRIYYGGNPSPIITEPQSGDAVRVDGTWRIAASTTCQLATLVAIQCEGQEGTTPVPPAGWDPNTVEPEIMDAFNTLADPAATTDARVAVVESGEDNRDVIAAGVAADRGLAGTVRFLVVGVRVSGDTAEVLYALSTTADGPATPYPVIGRAVRVNGTWKAAAQYACGISGFARQGCYQQLNAEPAEDP